MRSPTTPPLRKPLLDRRIGVHDRHQFELKLEYQPAAEQRQCRYLVEAFVCVPGNLNLTPDTVPPAELYADIHNYVRLKTPELSWQELQTSADSPLVRALADAPAVSQGGEPRRFGHECRLYACVFRAALRGFCEQVEAMASPGKPAVEEIAAIVDETVAGVTMATSRFRSVRTLVENTPGSAESAKLAYRFADEYTSISIEQQLRRAIVCLAQSVADSRQLRQRLLDVILAEESYRIERGYPCVLRSGTDNEAYVYRSGLLKKLCASVLFLHVHRLGTRHHWQELLFAVAAGISMAFATIIAFWAQARYTGLGLRLFVILVVAYMFKDRIKEAGRRLFSSFLEKYLFDHKIVIEDPEGGILGCCREKIEYCPRERLPEDVRAIRLVGADPMVRAAEEELRETVYRYRKEVTLLASRLYGRRGGAGVTDIVRFHIARLLREMDEPYQTIEWVDRESHALAPLRAAKVYHVDVVFRFISRADEPPATTLMRLILDRRGIKRIERIDRPATPEELVAVAK
ncbi:MAG: hypothetical protein V2A73_10440 [Pseudomonadota bacterium]